LYEFVVGLVKASPTARGYSFVPPASIPLETKVFFGLHPCKVVQKGHWENVTLSGSLSISARSISTCVGISRFVFGHLNINCVNGISNGARLTAFLHARNKLLKGLSRAERWKRELMHCKMIGWRFYLRAQRERPP
jgi:hypothetical protein